MKVTKKPSRRDLLRVVERLQDLIGEAQARVDDDRDPNRVGRASAVLTEAFDLCVEARAYDPPASPHGTGCHQGPR